MKRVDKKKVVSSEHPIVKKKIDRALKRSIHEGKYAMAEAGFGGANLKPFVIAAGTSSALVGVFDAILSFVPSLVQMRTAKLVEKHSRKKITVPFAYLEGFAFLLMAIVALLFFFEFYFNQWFVVIAASLMYIVGAPANMAWFSWMGSLVPKEKRGDYFAKRNVTLGIVHLTTMLLGALILDYFKTYGLVMIAFSLVFFIAFVAKFISVTLLAGQYEPRLKVTKKDEFSFLDFLKNIKKTPFGRFSLYVFSFRVIWSIGGPFFAVYMLRDLGFSYFQYMAVVVSMTLFQLMFYPLMGKISDKYGNVRLMRIANIAIAITPFLWLLSPNIFYLIFVVQLTAGIGTGGFILSSNNYLYDSLNQRKRTFGLSYFNFMNGAGMAIGALIGSSLALTNFTFLGYTTLFIISISGIGRIIFLLLSKGFLKEVKHVDRFKYGWVARELRAEGVHLERHALNNVRGTVEHVIRPKDLKRFGKK